MTTRTGLCECGCGEETALATMNCATRGLVKGQPNRFVNGHQTKGNPNNYVVNETGCWIWQGAVNNRGYPRLRVDNHEWLAHRWHYEHSHGPIADGLVLDHLCRVPRCVNPDHLKPVSLAVNVRRGRTPRLTRMKVAEILASTASNTELARLYAVSQPTICNIRTGRTWADVSPEILRRRQREYGVR